MANKLYDVIIPVRVTKRMRVALAREATRRTRKSLRESDNPRKVTVSDLCREGIAAVLRGGK